MQQKHRTKFNTHSRKKKFQKKKGIKRNFSNSIKSIYENPTASILTSSERPKAEYFPPKIRNKTRMPALTTLTQRSAGRSGCPCSLGVGWGINTKIRRKSDLEGQPWKVFKNVVLANNWPREKNSRGGCKEKNTSTRFQ